MRSESAITSLGVTSIKERIYDVLKEEILNLIIPPGSRLIEREIGERFGVSKTPIREALNKLRGEGLVDIIQWKGAVVRTITREDVIQHFDIRTELEGLAVRLAYPHLRKEDIRSLEETIQRCYQLSEMGDHIAYAETDNEFHMIFVSRANNSLLKRLFDVMMNDIISIRVLCAKQPSITRKASRGAAKEHEDIVSAIKSGDPIQAEHLMKLHIIATKEDFLKAEVSL